MSGLVVALSGGIGGAKLALGLSRVLPPQELLVVANTGDDFEHLGFYICPDIDTLIYTLGGVSNTAQGWGRADETWSFMETLRASDPEQAWFLLGDKDLETHRARTASLRDGASLTEVTARLARRFGVAASILPMSDDPVRTHLQVEDESGIRRIEYRGSLQAKPSRQLQFALQSRRVRAVILCPSNPFLSIDPILALPGLREMLIQCGAPVVAVSPVVGGKALKGPTAKIMAELGMASDCQSIARHYSGLLDGLVIDQADREQHSALETSGLRVTATQTVMQSLADRERLARGVLDFADALAHDDPRI